MRVSNRPQRYETCILKEGDMEVMRTDIGNFVNPPRVPIRAVLNNMTFSVYDDTEHFDSVIFSTELKSLAIRRFDKDDSCFVVSNTHSFNVVTLCSLQNT